MTSGPVRSAQVRERAADWSGRLSGRRRSSQQSPAALLANFDTTVQQVDTIEVIQNESLPSVVVREVVRVSLWTADEVAPPPHPIRDWVSVEVDMLRTQAVAVGDVDEILQQLDKQKGVLRELEQKKPQLDELLHTAESLKGTENRQQLHGKDFDSIVKEAGYKYKTRVTERTEQK
ncbi:unnamed protein product [Spodoptera littoralis]|uniref:Uncharacterized protein n=1 Tax=Spodoptera littoralis TaxID=7109 RepID=A0A9P0HYQ9_SPOLI|nr:unnamed protein product [Spodoptera littoralis]CAH1636252.1 unnamed protein product [Spodoptera littoralis]